MMFTMRCFTFFCKIYCGVLGGGYIVLMRLVHKDRSKKKLLYDHSQNTKSTLFLDRCA